MAVGESILPDFNPVAGFQIGVASAGIKKPGRKDLVVMEVCEGAKVAAVFTLNKFCAAPVHVAKKHLKVGSPRYLVINTGNANAGTGNQGMKDALAVCDALGSKTDVSAEAVLPFSTGVIGEFLPTDKIVNALDAAIADLSETHWAKAAEGIMTTDTRPKGFSKQVQLSQGVVTISGISKGAGMICPNMATMLAYVACDAKLDAELLDKLLRSSVNQSFNRISIDGDTSTNDACVLVATGRGPEVKANTEDAELLFAAMQEAFAELAKAIVKDGEGATKFVTVNVAEADTSEDALKVGYAIAHSPLVKTALFASDPNWGRILAVVGRAGLDVLNIDKVNIYLDDVCIVENGGKSATYTEEKGQAVMNMAEITITVQLGAGSVSETVWTSDLSHEYVTINAEYRT